MDIAFIPVAMAAAIRQIPTTLLIAFSSLIIGLVFGLGIALIRVYSRGILSIGLRWLVTITKGIPFVLILLVAYLVSSDWFDSISGKFGWQVKFKDVNPAWIAIFALSIMAVVGASEIFRGSLASIKRPQIDAATSVGLTSLQTTRRIVLPQAIRVSIPMVGNLLIGLIKGSALGSMVMVNEVLNASLAAGSHENLMLESYVAAALVYWGMTIVIEQLLRLIEKKLSIQGRG